MRFAATVSNLRNRLLPKSVHKRYRLYCCTKVCAARQAGWNMTLWCVELWNSKDGRVYTMTQRNTHTHADMLEVCSSATSSHFFLSVITSLMASRMHMGVITYLMVWLTHLGFSKFSRAVSRRRASEASIRIGRQRYPIVEIAAADQGSQNQFLRFFIIDQQSTTSKGVSQPTPGPPMKVVLAGDEMSSWDVSATLYI